MKEHVFEARDLLVAHVGARRRGMTAAAQSERDAAGPTGGPARWRAFA